MDVDLAEAEVVEGGEIGDAIAYDVVCFSEEEAKRRDEGEVVGLVGWPGGG